MTKLSIAGMLAALTFAAAACGRPGQSAADTAVASSTTTNAATAPPDSVATPTESTATVSTVTRTAPVKKSSGSPTTKILTHNPARAINAVPGDSILGRDSVIRFPIRRLPTASSSPAKR